MEIFKMKIIGTIFLLSIVSSCLFFSCQHQSKVITPKEGIEPIDEGRLVFDIKLFNKHKKVSTTSETYMARYEYTDPTGTAVFLFSDSLTYEATYRHPDSLLWQYYRYYPNGQLKIKSNEFLKGNFTVGKEYYYDLDGNVERIIDYDTIFPISLNYVFDFMKEKGIDFEKDVNAIFKGKAIYHENTGEMLDPDEWRIYTDERIWRIDAYTGEQILEPYYWE